LDIYYYLLLLLIIILLLLLLSMPKHVNIPTNVALQPPPVLFQTHTERECVCARKCMSV